MKKELYTSQFEGKKITVMGLGVLGRGLQVTQFLAECGAKLTVTDLKTKEALETSLKALRKYKIKYVLGKHNLKDFENADMVVKAAGVSMDSEYIIRAKKRNIPVVMDASLFAKTAQVLKPQVTIIGVTGTRGKSMTTALIYHILKSNEKMLGHTIHLGGNMRMKATLPLLKKVSAGDIVVLELDSWQLQGFGDDKISPHISVFTSFMPDHMNYYKNSMKKYFADKANIFKWQKAGDILVTSKEMLKMLPKKHKGKVALTNVSKIKNIPMHIFGEHNAQNASYAYEVAKQVGLHDKQIRTALESFSGLEGRLENVGAIKGIHIINDNNATTPEATMAGILAVKEKYKDSKIILIAGGADKKLDLGNMTKTIHKHCSHIVLLSGTGTEQLKPHLHTPYSEHNSLKSALSKALDHGNTGDVILFSPGFASFGMFIHEYDRNDQFLKIIKNLKQ